MQENIVIIGNGISGTTLARYIRKQSDKKITLISNEHDYFFSRTALMYVYMGHMKFEHTQPYENWFWEKNRIQLKTGYVTNVDSENKTLKFIDGSTFSYDKLIIATGSKFNKFGWKGQDLEGVTGMYHKQDLEQIEQYAPNNETCKRGVIVGGGLIGVELAEMLRTRNIPVTFLVRENSFWGNVLPLGDSEMISRHIESHGVDLRFGVNLGEIKANENGRASSVIIKETGEEILCDMVGLTAGVSPNIDLLKESTIETDKGVLVNRYFETTADDVYAIGDCAQQREPIGNRRPVEAVWYTGRIMGETLAQTICGNKTAYSPGHWFNSAKFFDIEYQTYGWVFSEPKEGNAHFHWKHDDDTKCITIEYDTTSREFKGINSLGIRMKHNLFDQWLSANKTVEFVVNNLAQANFDPEFYKTFHHHIQEQFTSSQLENAHHE